jgi:hypothetical protein
MLVGESQGFDLQKVLPSHQTIEVDTQRMRGQLGIEPGTQAPKGMGMVDLDVNCSESWPLTVSINWRTALYKCCTAGRLSLGSPPASFGLLASSQYHAGGLFVNRSQLA